MTETSLQERAIPSTGEMLPVVGLGTWQTFDVGVAPRQREPLAAVLREFAALGGRLIDSSPMYGKAEEAVGSLVAETRLPAKPFIATKVWTRGKEAGVRQMQESLRKLRVRACDLMQVHNLVDVDTHLDTLAEWKGDGRVRYVGITHYNASGGAEIVTVLQRRGVDCVQINYSPAEREAERRLLPLCAERGIAVLANRPFGSGDLIARLRGKPLPAWAAELACDSWPQLVLKWIVAHPAITCAIPATADAAHARDDMKAAHGPLPGERMRARIAEAIR